MRRRRKNKTRHKSRVRNKINEMTQKNRKWMEEGEELESRCRQGRNEKKQKSRR
jgi:hypothetical protein